MLLRLFLFRLATRARAARLFTLAFLYCSFRLSPRVLIFSRWYSLLRPSRSCSFVSWAERAREESERERPGRVFFFRTTKRGQILLILMPQSGLEQRPLIYRSMDFCAAASAILHLIARPIARVLYKIMKWRDIDTACMCTACVLHVMCIELSTTTSFDYEYHWMTEIVTLICRIWFKSWSLSLGR